MNVGTTATLHSLDSQASDRQTKIELEQKFLCVCVGKAVPDKGVLGGSHQN